MWGVEFISGHYKLLPTLQNISFLINFTCQGPLFSAKPFSTTKSSINIRDRASQGIQKWWNIMTDSSNKEYKYQILMKCIDLENWSLP
jgi:hypothetical protein